jgi:hypothetical protein
MSIIEDASKDVLTGKYFHSYKVNANGFIAVDWQGRILAQVQRGLYIYLVETYDWMVGDVHSTFLVPVVDMAAAHPKPWTFYESAEEMREAYKHGPASAYSFNSHRKCTTANQALMTGGPEKVRRMLNKAKPVVVPPADPSDT